MPRARLRVYRWWPALHAKPIELEDRATLARHLTHVAIIAGGLCLPPVTRATGISPASVLAIILVHVAWMVVLTFVISPSRKPTPIRFHVALAGSVLVNAAICVAFPVLGGDPKSPLWMLPVMYACFNGGIQELAPSRGILLVHSVMPLVGIPVFLAGGVEPGWSIAAPLLCSAVSALGYDYLALMSARFREMRQAQAEALASVRARLEEEASTRLARDLHDALGSSLAIVGLYGDLIERHVNRPDQLRAIAAMVREAARAGTDELGALMGAMRPPTEDVDGLVDVMTDMARRASEASGITIAIRVMRGGSVRLDGPVRLALVRVFQEAVHNSLQHARAERVDVCFAANDVAVSLELTDDGIGFLPSDVPSGRGLRGMSARASELGGTFLLAAAPGSGTRVSFELPMSPTAAAS
jgi:signal transduction histidine kinase